MADEQDYESLYVRVDAKLKAVADALFAPPPWSEALSKLRPESSEGARLAVYQTIRRSGILPDEVSFFLVSRLIDDMATRDADEALGGYEERLKEIEKAYRLEEGGLWPAGTAPEGYDQLREEYHQAWDRLFAQKLEQYGEPEMARLFREKSGVFDALTNAGWKFFADPGTAEDSSPLAWVRSLVDAVAGCITADSPMGPLGYRWREEEGAWQIDIYPTPVELIGGAVDGEIVAPDFSLDLEELRTLFDRVDAFNWQALGLNYPEGTHVSIESIYHGHEVFLQVLAYAPDDEEPGMKLDTKPPKH